MLDRIVDMTLYLVERAWVICATLLAIAFIGIVTAIVAPEIHPERIIVRID